jgi:hypothetical protein
MRCMIHQIISLNSTHTLLARSLEAISSKMHVPFYSVWFSCIMNNDAVSARQEGRK